MKHLDELHRHSEQEKARQRGATLWSDRLAVRHELVWLSASGPNRVRSRQCEIDHIAESGAGPSLTPGQAARLERHRADTAALHVALRRLFGGGGFPVESLERDVKWRHDPLGKPYVFWQNDAAAWGREQGIASGHLHVTNTHDGDAHLVLTCVDERLAGAGIDLVHLPRLQRAGKNAAYLRRLARQFMSEAEWEGFAAASAQDTEEQLRVRVAAHFSLMEAASKACGTGLRIGAGMGRPESLPKQALGVRHLAPEVEFLFGPEAVRRQQELGATRREGYWSASDERLVSLVLLWKE